MRTAAVVMLGVLMTGCVNLTAPDPVTEPFRIEEGDYGPVTDAHRTLIVTRWEELQGCLGLRYDSRGFRFTLRRNEGGPWIAYYTSGWGQKVGGNYYPRVRIEALGDPQWVQAWKHEMMHYLLDMSTGDSDPGHARGGLRVYGAGGESQGADWLRCTTS